MVTALGLLAAAISAAQGLPADTTFSLAVTENSNNHVGARRLFLDFQDAPATAGDASRGIVVSAPLGDALITLDGDVSDWDPSLFTDITGLVQSNYPLSEYVDAVRTMVTIGSAWDADHVYLVVRWQDAGLDASTRYQKWIYGGGEWGPQETVGATPGAPNEAAPNTVGHPLPGGENEDRVYLMFPIVDVQQNFLPDGPGCALYCHANLKEDNPFQDHTGKGVAVMGTNLPGDRADIWQWQSSRTDPSGHADDMVLGYATDFDNGLLPDAGEAPFTANELVAGAPTWMHLSGLGFIGDVLAEALAIPYTGTPLAGAEMPHDVSRPPAGSRADVETGASFDVATGIWTVEFRRLRDTGFDDDHPFTGADAAPPTATLVSAVDPVAGETLHNQSCVLCHGPFGLGNPGETGWIFSRIQRSSGSLILQAVEEDPQMQGLDVSEQEAEDIAAYLQTLATWGPVQGFGESCNGLLVYWENEPLLGSSDFKLYLYGVAPQVPAVLIAGISDDSWAGIPLPLDLGPFGGPGCSILVSPEVLLATTSDDFGEARFTIPVPADPALSGTRTYVQWAAVAGPDPLGLGFSAGLEITIP